MLETRQGGGGSHLSGLEILVCERLDGSGERDRSP